MKSIEWVVKPRDGRLSADGDEYKARVEVDCKGGKLRIRGHIDGMGCFGEGYPRRVPRRQRPAVARIGDIYLTDKTAPAVCALITDEMTEQDATSTAAKAFLKLAQELTS